MLPAPAEVLRHHGDVIFPMLAQWRESGNVPPVLLLTGPQGVGKRTVAHFLAQALLCERAGFSTPPAPHGDEEPGLGLDLFGGSGETPAPAIAPAASSKNPCSPNEGEAPCDACRRAWAGSWVDFQEIAPEESESGKTGSLKIDQFHGLKAAQGFGAREGSYRVTLIRDADHLTPQAANSLLKLLEEPPRGWVLLLTASDLTLLLPTLVSRCQTARLRPFTPEELRPLLAPPHAAVPPDRVDVCARLAQGSWKKALALADEDAWTRRREIFRFLETPQAGLSPLVDWAAQEDGNFRLMLDQLEQIVADLARWAATQDGVAPAASGSHAWANRDAADWLANYAARTAQRDGGARAALARWLEIASHLSRARQRMDAPLNRRLLAQDVLIPWFGG